MRVRLRGGVVVLSVYLCALGAFAQDASYALPLPPPAPTHSRAGRMALAEELRRFYTRYPSQLVNLMEATAGAIPGSPSVTLLLWTAYAETTGDGLDVSEAGAVGLAQATPVAYRQERLDGKLFVTRDYLSGARSYILKKPLHDADVIATMVIDAPTSVPEAKRLLASAMQLREEGVSDLELLSPFAGQPYFDSIKQMDAHNLEVLTTLDRVLDNGDQAALHNLRDGARAEYRDLLHRQAISWRRYQADLAYARDRALTKHFHANARAIRRQEPYLAGEYLARTLDARFSPYIM